MSCPVLTSIGSPAVAERDGLLDHLPISLAGSDTATGYLARSLDVRSAGSAVSSGKIGR